MLNVRSLAIGVSIFVAVGLWTTVAPTHHTGNGQAMAQDTQDAEMKELRRRVKDEVRAVLAGDDWKTIQARIEAEVRQQSFTRIRTALECSDAEWKVFQPL